jgi:hypothetical protein
MKTIFLLLIFTLSCTAADQVKSVEIKPPEGWRSEVIKLPPGFAKDMKFGGEETIYFAPGMFNPQAADFFSYTFILDGKYPEKLTQKEVEAELLRYYKGLGGVVGKKFKVDASKFKISLKETKKEKGSVVYSGTLDWIEPFKTGKPQKLNFEITTWSTGKKDFLFAVVSPAKKDSEIWKKLLKVKADLEIK